MSLMGPCDHGGGYYTSSMDNPPVARCMWCGTELPINVDATVERVDPMERTMPAPPVTPRPALRVIKGGRS